MSVLLCDIGGTNTRFALARANTLGAASHRRFRNDEYPDFPAILRDFVKSCGSETIDHSVVAVAAIADGDVVSLTNRDWEISRSDISAVTGSTVDFINDYTALAAALSRTENLDLQNIRKGEPTEDGTRLVLGAGTGFNAACLLPGSQSKTNRILTAEAGHAGFAAQSTIELELRNEIHRRFGRCSNDRALSGAGFLALYRLICHRNDSRSVHDDPAAICAAALIGADENCSATGRIFAAMLGRVAGDLALTFLATGGVFIAGGVARALSPLIASAGGDFEEAFLDKGRMRDFMDGFAVDLLTRDEAGLEGSLAWLNMTSTAHQARSAVQQHC